MSLKQALIALCRQHGMHVIINRDGARIDSVDLWAKPGTCLEGNGQGHCYVANDWRDALQMARWAIKHGGPHVCPSGCECYEDSPEPYGCREVEPCVWES